MTGPETFTMPIIRDPGIGDGRAEVGSEQWARRVRAELGSLVPSIGHKPKSVAGYLRLLRERDGWRLLTDKNGRAFTSLEEFCETPTPWGLGTKLADLERWLRVDGPASAPIYWTPEERYPPTEDETAALEVHPAANLFPMLDDKALAALAADIKANGLRDPIVLWEGKIIDGRNRMTACQRAEVRPTFTTLLHCPDPVTYVLSANLHRRHLTDDERALCAASLKDHYQKKTAAAHAEASKAGGLKAGNGRSVGVAPPDATPIDGAKWTELAASDWKTSPKSIERADAIKAQPELHGAVKAKAISLSRAATIAKGAKAGIIDEEEVKAAVVSKEAATAAVAKINEAKPKRPTKTKLAPEEAPAPAAKADTFTGDATAQLSFAYGEIGREQQDILPNEATDALAAARAYIEALRAIKARRVGGSK